MKIVITGASGFVGQNLVPILVLAGDELLLAGRDTQKLRRLFPAVAVCAYDDLPVRAKGFDKLLHLAVANNNLDATINEFRTANVQFACEIAKSARDAGIGCFVNVSSIHALDDKNQSPYAVTKREAVFKLREMAGLNVVSVYLPLVYGDQWGGSLSRLNKLPRVMATVIFQLLAALKPVVQVNRLADYVRKGTGDGADVIISDNQDRNVVYRFIKRVVDLCFAAGVLFLLGWLMLVIWILIRFQSPGPGFFVQERVGRDAVRFKCVKFRTMKLGTLQAATHEVSASAITPLGNFLRKTKIDELPQIWNIFRNEVSLVGPRPCLAVQAELIAARMQRGVLSIKPGITGLAQVNGIDMSDPRTLAEWDCRYFKLRSLLLDLKILLATALGAGWGDRVKAGDALRDHQTARDA
jgi:lipopolysaccharide/colanic/teichoic acid biosynthesis glycosyltransferase